MKSEKLGKEVKKAVWDDSDEDGMEDIILSDFQLFVSRRQNVYCVSLMLKADHLRRDMFPRIKKNRRKSTFIKFQEDEFTPDGLLYTK